MSGALRSALASAALPAVNDDDLQAALAAAEDAAFDLRNAVDAARRVNDPDGLPSVGVEAIVAAEGVEAAAKALKGRFEALCAAARDRAGALREGLAAAMDEAGCRRAEGSAHFASVRDGFWKSVVTDEAAVPLGLKRTSVKPDLARIGKEHDAGREVPGAARVRGPRTVQIKPLSEATPKRSAAR